MYQVLAIILDVYGSIRRETGKSETASPPQSASITRAYQTPQACSLARFLVWGCLKWEYTDGPQMHWFINVDHVTMFRIELILKSISPINGHHTRATGGSPFGVCCCSYIAEECG